MKKLTTLAFAALIALTLSMPAWSQATTSGNQPKTAAKQDKKEAKGKKQAKKKATKDTNKETKKDATKK
jgi:hypothetical protein